MSSLRERLAAKAKRRVVVPVTLGQPSDEDATRLALAQAQVLAAIKEGDDERRAQAQAEVDAITDETTARVGFTALEPDEFEKVSAAYTNDEGELDWKTALPMLAGLCADDEDLQDDDFWREQLESGTWNQGERLALWQALLHINSTTPNPYVPKG